MSPTAGRALAMLIAVAALVGCGGPPRAKTTFLRSVDLLEMTSQMSRSFAGDEIIAEAARDAAQNDPWTISIDRVVNHTNQLIPEREKWLYVARLRALLAQSDIGDRAGIRWVMPVERWRLVADEIGGSPTPYGIRVDPTHQLSATFDALTITSGGGRSDTYLCAYELVDLRTGVVKWQDDWEVKRALSGVTWD